MKKKFILSSDKKLGFFTNDVKDGIIYGKLHSNKHLTFLNEENIITLHKTTMNKGEKPKRQNLVPSINVKKLELELGDWFNSELLKNEYLEDDLYSIEDNLIKDSYEAAIVPDSEIKNEKNMIITKDINKLLENFINIGAKYSDKKNFLPINRADLKQYEGKILMNKEKLPLIGYNGKVYSAFNVLTSLIEGKLSEIFGFNELELEEVIEAVKKSSAIEEKVKQYLMPPKIFVGIDGSGTPGFKQRKPFDFENPEKNKEIDKEWFTLATIVTHDINSADDAVNEINDILNGESTKNRPLLVKEFDSIAKVLLSHPLRFFLLTFNKYDCPPDFALKLKKFVAKDSSTGFKYTAFGKIYSMPIWISLSSLIKANYKGEMDIKMDNDIHASPWIQFEQEIKTHIQNHVGSCSIEQKDNSYSLIKIADIIAYMANYQLKNKIFENNQLKLNLTLNDSLVRTRLYVHKKTENEVEIVSDSFSEPDYTKFFPWQ